MKILFLTIFTFNTFAVCENQLAVWISNNSFIDTIEECSGESKTGYSKFCYCANFIGAKRGKEQEKRSPRQTCSKNIL